MRTPTPQHVKSVHRQWIFRTQTDPELGGPLLRQRLSVARQTLNRYGSKSLKTFLAESRLGSHPELIRLLWRVGSERL